MYTANTMASAAEALGMTLPGSSSFPAEYPEKAAECDSIGGVMRNLLEKDILPRQIMTRKAFENAMVSYLAKTIFKRFYKLAGSNDGTRWIDKCSSSSHRCCSFRWNRTDY